MRSSTPATFWSHGSSNSSLSSRRSPPCGGTTTHRWTSLRSQSWSSEESRSLWSTTVDLRRDALGDSDRCSPPQMSWSSGIPIFPGTRSAATVIGRRSTSIPVRPPNADVRRLARLVGSRSRTAASRVATSTSPTAPTQKSEDDVEVRCAAPTSCVAAVMTLSANRWSAGRVSEKHVDSSGRRECCRHRGRRGNATGVVATTG